MSIAGIDIGSRYIKFVLLHDNNKFEYFKKDTGHNPMEECNDFINKYKPKSYIATGYGRHLLEVYSEAETITEIKAVGLGAHHFFPNCRTIIDIGGQDTKAIALNSKGRVVDFLMNDRCAAGTGKFFEVIAKTLDFDVNDLSNLSDLDYDKNMKINSMCTVFAESEIIGLINRGITRKYIAASLHYSVADRVISLAKRVGINDDIVFTGGCARNLYLRDVIEKRLNRDVKVYEVPDILSAYGAALFAKQKIESGVAI